MKRGTTRSAWLRGIIAGMLALQLAIGTWAGSVWAADASVNPQPADPAAAAPTRAQLDEALGALQASLANANPVSDWVALGLARSGKSVADRYLPQAAKSAGDGSLRLVTDYARLALAVNANGGDARKVGPNGLDLLGKIANFDKMTAQGPNAPAFALLALDAGNYPAPGSKDRWTKDALIQWLVDNRTADGGWSLVPGKSDVDITGIVLTALAPYYDKNAAVKAAVDSALGWLSGVQKPNGGFGSPESSESSVQVLLALTSLGIDPVQDARFLKNGKSALTRLMEFRQPNGQFAHLPGGKGDGLASLYALLGLTAVERWMDGLPGLYAGQPAGQQVQVTVTGPNGKLAEAAVNGRSGMELFVETVKRNHVPYEVVRDPQYGAYLTSVSSFKNGQFGGYDGWQYAVKRGGQWLAITQGLSAFVPQAGDQVFIYYGGTTALIHSIKVEPAAAREGQPIQVTIEKEVYDWDSGKADVSPAEEARVSLGGVSAVTDKEGKATLRDVPKGKHTLVVDGYRTGGAPAYVAVEQPYTVASYVKQVSVRVEGDQRTIAEGTARGGTALEALEAMLKAKQIGYEVKETSFGKYVSSIGGIQAGKFGGYDGWLFAVKDGGQCMVPAEGIGTFLLDDGQELVVYYGDNTKLAEPAAVTPQQPKPGQPVTVKVTYRDMNWETGKLQDPKPLAGVKVSAGGAAATTDADGNAKLSALPEGVHTVSITGYTDGKAPLVVRTVSKLTVAASYNDQNAVSVWAADSVRTARAAGILNGPADSLTAFQPKEAITRAEFVAALVRAIGLKPAAGSTFGDVSPKAWYAKEIEAAAKAGLVSGVAPGKFAPDAKLTREQAAQLLTKALKLTAATSTALVDGQQVSRGAMPAVQAVLDSGWMTAYEGKFAPKQSMTREQAAVVTVKVLLKPGIGKLGA
ncbi:hypothetical protein E5161_19110 [Cohnella pontilimi]|uniref:SLH domain-containing protein n=1 Tax=Cohnella pontilimi TaxID=2564100 RepID=A0A4U0F7I9_9BACL|nr:S-layer homology domain-containing protein [Cohnella pontilimi]TJY38942.1 hypothetical protein E5161_19110 [Cohnella pontilimi]